MNFVKRLMVKTRADEPRQDSGPRELSERAQRYPVTAPVRFRRTGHLGWRSGKTVNLSRSGVLFESEAALPEGTVVDLAISLPPRPGTEGSKTVVASAIVVRQFEERESAERLVLAARIVSYSV